MRDSVSPEYRAGIAAHAAGSQLDENPFGSIAIRARCAWSAGWFDASRGLVSGDKPAEPSEPAPPHRPDMPTLSQLIARKAWR